MRSQVGSGKLGRSEGEEQDRDEEESEGDRSPLIILIPSGVRSSTAGTEACGP